MYTVDYVTLVPNSKESFFSANKTIFVTVALPSLPPCPIVFESEDDFIDFVRLFEECKTVDEKFKMIKTYLDLLYGKPSPSDEPMPGAEEAK